MTEQTAKRSEVQEDRRVAGAILRGAAGSRAMAAARASAASEAGTPTMPSTLTRSRTMRAPPICAVALIAWTAPR